jgi:hypothetical protein
MGSFLRDELNLYAENLTIESSDSDFDYYDHLFKRTCEIVEDVFEELDLFKDVEAVRELIKTHKIKR